MNVRVTRKRATEAAKRARVRRACGIVLGRLRVTDLGAFDAFDALGVLGASTAEVERGRGGVCLLSLKNVQADAPPPSLASACLVFWSFGSLGLVWSSQVGVDLGALEGA